MEKRKRAGRASLKALAKRRQAVAAIAIGTVVALGMVLALAISGGETAPGDDGRSQILGVEALREAVAGSDTPVYWAGEQDGTKLELTRPDASKAYVRYLTGDAEAGTHNADFLTVATYVRPHPVEELRRQGNAPGVVLGEAPGGAVVYYNRNHPQSVYLAYPGVGAQIEVYDPDVRRALQLVNSGQIVALG